MRALPATTRADLAARLTPRFAPGGYVPHVPHPPQQVFLLLSRVAEVFYGGAAGGGKSDAVLMGALQYADVPGYSALIIRRTYADLALPGAIMERAGSWLGPTRARKHDGGKSWTFPTEDPARPARLTFGYAQTYADVTRYQSAEFQFIGVDELTHFEERTYRYMFSRLRGPALPCAHCGHPTSQPAGKLRDHDEGHDVEHPDCGCTTAEPDRSGLIAAKDGMTLADVPLRMRSGSNPGGLGHEWVKRRFVDAETRERSSVFVPAKIADNPSLDRRAYRASLQHLDAVEIARLESGDWEATDEGDVFKREWFKVCDRAEVPTDLELCRYWDLAATAVDARKKGKQDPDWTVGALVGLHRASGAWFILDVVRRRADPFDVERLIASTARADGRRVRQRMEQEGGSSGKATVDHYRRDVLVGLDFDGVRPSGSKLERARPVARAMQPGLVTCVAGGWTSGYVDELAAFPQVGVHDDQVDATSGAFEVLSAPRSRLIA